MESKSNSIMGPPPSPSHTITLVLPSHQPKEVTMTIITHFAEDETKAQRG
jgi:hypothetical protein